MPLYAAVSSQWQLPRLARVSERAEAGVSFTQRDPIDDPLEPHGWNRYIYVGDDPCNDVDPFGAMGRCGEARVHLYFRGRTASGSPISRFVAFVRGVRLAIFHSLEWAF